MTKIQYAVAAALALGASAAQAGITIPAGDWTIDIGGNVNAFATWHDTDTAAASVLGGTAGSVLPGAEDKAFNINTGLLPSAIGIGGKSRQNDLDVAFQFTFFPGVSADGIGGGAGDSAFGNNSLNIRQVYLTFGDKSWGTVKVGRDLGIFGSDAILSDMTLLGVGAGGAGSGNTTLGPSVPVTCMLTGTHKSPMLPRLNGFSFNVGIFDPWNSTVSTGATGLAATADSQPQYQGKGFLRMGWRCVW